MSVLATLLARLRYRLFGTVRRGKTLGARGENAAADYLRRLGYRILAVGERTPAGEIDIIAIDGRTVVFIEVKTRTTHDAGHPAEAVSGAKQRRISHIALAFLKHHGLLETPARFDIIAVTWPEGVREPDIQHYISAFEAISDGSMY